MQLEDNDQVENVSLLIQLLVQYQLDDLDLYLIFKRTLKINSIPCKATTCFS